MSDSDEVNIGSKSASWEEGERCSHCPHEWDHHIFWAKGDPTAGGIITCPEDDCDCYMTWSATPEVQAQADRFKAVFNEADTKEEALELMEERLREKRERTDGETPPGTGA